MKEARRPGRPVIAQCCAHEAGEHATKTGRRFAKTNEKHGTSQTVWVYSDNAGIPVEYRKLINSLDLPVHEVDLRDRRMVFLGLQGLTKDHRVIVVYDSESEFRRRGYYNHSLQHNLMYRIHCGSFGFFAARRHD
ncbi:hypothetical protein [Neorhizobium galegae]|uniref:hypothetical protein n=1 Tax=Neorhizobium galegae TaxID=399 RepID=UPI00127006DD|nr:hypothetical protein [Neorhizobium galegae]KAA9385714.1 hypothetical protein F4V88_04170 [Neorhizobium galegae]MCM2497346.1 hypothetical protein [Neorhizobium galegae]